MILDRASHPRVAVTSPSFSCNKVLKAEIESLFPDCRLNTTGKRLEGKDLVVFLSDVDAIIVGLEKIDASILEQCRKLKIIAKYGVGLDNIDLEACARAGITIGWTGGVNRVSVSEMTLGFMLALCRNLFSTSLLMKNGVWNKEGGFQLSGKTVGVIGAGHVGREVIRLLKPFCCKIMVNDIIDIDEYCSEHNLIPASKENIFSSADIISIHTTLDASTQYMVNRKTLTMMKSSAYLINTARGGIVCQDDLAWALNNGEIAGAAVDVYEEEPPDDREFLLLPNLICTPHIGGNSSEAVLAMGMSAINHLKEFYQR